MSLSEEISLIILNKFNYNIVVKQNNSQEFTWSRGSSSCSEKESAKELLKFIIRTLDLKQFKVLKVLFLFKVAK